MTKFIVKYDNDLCSSIELNGHADYAKYGQDIVCSGITATVFTSINLIEKIDSKSFELIQDEDKGYLKLTLSLDKCSLSNREFIIKVIDNLIDMMKELKKQYPKNIEIEIL